MAGTEPVTSPDQHKPTPVKGARIAAVLSIIALLAMTIGNHEGSVEDLWLVGIAGTIAALVIIDAVMRRNGLR